MIETLLLGKLSKNSSKEEYEKIKKYQINPITIVYEHKSKQIIYNIDGLIAYIMNYNCDPSNDEKIEKREFKPENLQYIIKQDKEHIKVFAIEHDKNTPLIIKQNYTKFEIYPK